LIIGILAIAARLVAINAPFIDAWSWRQSDVATIARNFAEHGFHFAYPQIDWAGNEPGYVGTEFPILPFLAALAYRALGEQEWVGRVQAVIFFALSLPFFFQLTRDLFDREIATWALFFYSFAPICIMASRCFMPDIPSLSLSLVALALFLQWSQSERLGVLFASAVACSLAILFKAPTALIGAPLTVLAWQRFGARAFCRWDLWVYGAIALLPSLGWYGHAWHIAQQFYPYHFFGAGGFQIKSFDWYLEIAGVTIWLSLAPALFLFALVGIFSASRYRPGLLVFGSWAVVMALFIFVAGWGNRHPWYQLPLVPIAASFAGVCCERWRRVVGSSRTRSLAFTAAVVLLATAATIPGLEHFYRPAAVELRQAGLALKELTPPGALVVAADYGDPTVFYYARRKGWNFMEKDAIYAGHPLDGAEAVADLKSLQAKGATSFVLYSGTFWWLKYYPEFSDYLTSHAELKANTPAYRIYELHAERQ
jgi:4-amino-4-deoxy-L-arabinose transferase-like glycosyltransferase